jgi:SAM-dependent methyltransferase
LIPESTGKSYDAIAHWWRDQERSSTSGLEYLRRAIARCGRKRHALDVGCGSAGRIMHELLDAGFHVTGVDVSAAMLALAREAHPEATFVRADMCAWNPPDEYDLIVAWDSTFHVPYASQAHVTRKLCRALAPAGVLLMTAGGRDGEVQGVMAGQSFYYSSLDADAYRRIVDEEGCPCELLEWDQPPDAHIVIMARRPGA